MVTIVTRAGKGSALTYDEMDANFTNLNTAKLETGSPASNISNTPSGNITATNVQDAINQAAIASNTSNTPAGNIAATNVQAAINELDTEKETKIVVATKAPLNSPTFTGTVTSPQYYNVTAAYGALQVGGADVFRFGQDNSGQLAGFRNILINGDMRVNQRAVANWAAVANGAYGYDRWKKVNASNMTQIVEAGNFVPSTIYTLSGIGVTTQQLTSPASGNWTLPNIPIAATYVQLEAGSIATPFEYRPIGLELSMCQRYQPSAFATNNYFPIAVGQAYSATAALFYMPFKVDARVAPTGLSYQSASQYSCTAASSSSVTSTGAILFVMASTQGLWFNVTGLSGLVAGNASMCFINTPNAFLHATGVEL